MLLHMKTIHLTPIAMSSFVRPVVMLHWFSVQKEINVFQINQLLCPVKGSLLIYLFEQSKKSVSYYVSVIAFHLSAFCERACSAIYSMFIEMCLLWKASV